MFIFAIQGSPRKKGNTAYLAETLLGEWKKRGADTHILHITDTEILPCAEYTVCERKGFCPLDDDMPDVFRLLRKADVVILAAPVFFYGFPGRCKFLIDRCQVLWARKYRLGLHDPGSAYRRGILCSVGATKGENLFDGMKLTSAYFFDALGADFAGSLVYRQVEHPGDLEGISDVQAEAAELVRRVQPGNPARRRVVFSSRTDPVAPCAGAVYLRQLAGDRYESGILSPELGEEERKLLVSAFAEEGIDAEYYPFPFIEQYSAEDLIISIEDPPPALLMREYRETLADIRRKVENSVV
jgi:multimeric flavodoxin WrbA